MNRTRSWVAISVLLTLIAVARILLTYPVTSQGYDETYHLACGMEWIDQGRYTLDLVHPPLARIAIALAPYLAGERFPSISPGGTTAGPSDPYYLLVGNGILYGDGHYLRNLSLARLGILPFLFLAVTVVFVWTRRLFGNFAALVAVILLTTLPIVLAFSGVAYTDFPAAAMMFAALFVIALWLESPTVTSSVLLGVALGLAFLTKFTAVVFVPVAALGMLITRWLAMCGKSAEPPEPKRRWSTRLLLAGVIACLLVWAGYRFSLQHMQEGMQLSPAAMPSFQHFPAQVRALARDAVLRNPLLPAPALLKGMATTWAFTHDGTPAYLLGKVKPGGYWYFFLLGIAVKTPLAALLLGLIGIAGSVELMRQRQWKAAAPAAALIALLVITTLVKYDAGLRHVLLVFPFMAMLGGYGALRLWHLHQNWRVPGRVLVAALLSAQLVSSLSAHPDYLAYFNFLAGSDPSNVLLTGCDLDCGQDLFKLSAALRERNVSHVNLAVWTTADLSRMGLPGFERLRPFEPVTGWVAIGVRSLRLGDVERNTYPPGGFAWLKAYQPVAQVGKTIALYHIPEGSASPTKLEQAKVDP